MLRKSRLVLRNNQEDGDPTNIDGTSNTGASHLLSSAPQPLTPQLKIPMAAWMTRHCAARHAKELASAVLVASLRPLCQHTCWGFFFFLLFISPHQSCVKLVSAAAQIPPHMHQSLLVTLVWTQTFFYHADAVFVFWHSLHSAWAFDVPSRVFQLYCRECACCSYVTHGHKRVATIKACKQEQGHVWHTRSAGLVWFAVISWRSGHNNGIFLLFHLQTFQTPKRPAFLPSSSLSVFLLLFFPCVFFFLLFSPCNFCFLSSFSFSHLPFLGCCSSLHVSSPSSFLSSCFYLTCSIFPRPSFFLPHFTMPVVSSFLLSTVFEDL